MNQFTEKWRKGVAEVMAKYNHHDMVGRISLELDDEDRLLLLNVMNRTLSLLAQDSPEWHHVSELVCKLS